MYGKTRHFTICHNDDNPRDPDHRRVELRLCKHGLAWWLESDEPGFKAVMMGHNITEAMHSLDAVYPEGGTWDRRPNVLPVRR